jgi:hypothetical protein
MPAFPTTGGSLEPLPDMQSLSDAELRDLIDRLVAEEHEVSYRRRILHGQIDILKAELQARLHRQVNKGEGPLYEVDVDKLAAILSAKAAPPNPAD